jgi:hypothetical protein
MHFQMQTGGALTIDAQLVVLQYILVAILYRGVPGNRLPSPGQARKQSISLKQMPLLRLYG